MPQQELFSSLFMNNDQPMTCPNCGAHTEIIFDLSHSIDQTQIHECVNKNCKEVFVSVSDKEFEQNDFSFENV